MLNIYCLDNTYGNFVNLKMYWYNLFREIYRAYDVCA
jgi:hypothetical protein